MKTSRNRLASGIIALSMFVAGCGTATSVTTEPGEVTTTSAPSVTSTAPTTTAATSTTTEPVSGKTTTTAGGVLDEAEGSGCSPGSGDLPGGSWYGYVVEDTGAEMEFDLACWFTGEAAVRAAAEDGEESPPPNDFYVRNVAQTTRSLDVDADVPVTWYPDFGDPTSETTTTHADWVIGTEDRQFTPGVWVEVENGRVVSIREQWVP